MILSKNYSHRCKALKEVLECLAKQSPPITETHSTSAVEKAVLQVLNVALKDRVFVVSARDIPPSVIMQVHMQQKN